MVAALEKRLIVYFQKIREVKRMNELEIRNNQKRVLAMLVKAKKNPAVLDEMIDEYGLEMQKEDVALVMRTMEKKDKE
jgi:uncharacterized membrane-anchored protein YjiN (DUF445 family)